MNIPESPWKAERASSSPAVDIAGGAAEDLASWPMMPAASSPAGELISGRGVLAGLHVSDDLAPGRHDERVDPDHVALVPVGLHPDHFLPALRRLDHLFPGEARRGGV